LRDDSVKALQPRSSTSWIPGLFLFAPAERRIPGLARQGSASIAAHNAGMSGILWVKALHIVFVSSWFAGLFYLPRIFVNLAQVPSDSHAERERLLLMARKLYRFAGLLMVGAIGLGVVLVVLQPGLLHGGYWLHAKLLLVVVAIGYHHMCRGMLRSFEKLENRRRERFFRVFNEMAVLLFAAIVVLVVVKPF
jgi:putative membrane protein